MMKQVAFFAATLAVTLTSSLAGQDQQSTSGLGEKIDLKVLFAGDPETTRTKDFVDFLGQHFSQVSFCEVSKYNEDDSTGHDVILLDSESFRTRISGLTKDGGRPTMLIGAFGGMTGSRLQVRTNYC